MKRNDDPKRIAARNERDRAEIDLRILCKGIGGTLAEVYPDSGAMQPIIDAVNGPLVTAIKRYESANEAFTPFWRRSRIAKKRSPKKKKAA